MNVLSLFDGISVAKLALDELGIEYETYTACEIDKYPIAISERNHPDIIRMEDVRDLQGSDVPWEIDLLVGGSPCQGFSLQGLQKGLEDDRSGLVSEFIRLKDELKPKYFLLENVKMKQECEDFISEALGCKPRKINSLHFVNQSRMRLYWTNIPVAELPEQPAWDFRTPEGNRSGTSRKGPPRRIVFTPHFGCLTASYYKGIRADGRPLITSVEGEFDEIKEFARKLTPQECEVMLQGVPAGYTEGVSNTQRYKALGNAFTLPVIKHIFRSLKVEQNRLKQKGSGKTIRSVNEVVEECGSFIEV